MKKLLVIATTFAALSGIVAADIHAPPGHTYTASRKLGRAISNIVYGFIEIPEQIGRKTNDYGRKAGVTYGAVASPTAGPKATNSRGANSVRFSIPPAASAGGIFLLAASCRPKSCNLHMTGRCAMELTIASRI